MEKKMYKYFVSYRIESLRECSEFDNYVVERENKICNYLDIMEVSQTIRLHHRLLESARIIILFYREF